MSEVLVSKEHYNELCALIEELFNDNYEEFMLFWNTPYEFFNQKSPKDAWWDTPASVLYLMKNYRYYTEVLK